MVRRTFSITLFLYSLLTGLNVWASEWSGYISTEMRYFFEDATDPRQPGSSFSFSAQPEFYHAWDNRKQSFTFVPFMRWDNRDDERSHADIRELTYLKASRDWELRLGIRKVFWGVTESQHLVDIINQSDLVENIDGEEKLGQPMINFAWIQNWGTLDLFILPGFRERTFPGIKGRPRTQPRVDTDQAIYASSKGSEHTDVALRWSHSIGDWEVGLSHFSGTSRDPELVPGLDAQNNPVLVPMYLTIDQTSLDLQLVTEAWLWKLEAITRQGQTGGRYFATVGGFEYTLIGIAESDADLGLIAEYHFDDREKSAPTPFDNDLMLGTRLTLNDAQSTDALLGVNIDLDGHGHTISLEASRRFGSSWKASLESRFFNQIDMQDPISSYRNDDYLQVELAYYF